jgi:hypothetical protein
MRSPALLMAVIGVAAVPLAAGAGPGGMAARSARPIVAVDTRCGDRRHWEAAGYDENGKWRDARCAAD